MGRTEVRIYLMDRRAEAREKLRERRYEEAAAMYEELARAAGPERPQDLAFLSGAYWKLGRVADALRVGREALDVASAGADESAEALAACSLGSAMLDDFLNKGPSAPDWDVFGEAMDLLGRAAALYEGFGSVDYAASLLSMAEGYCTVEIYDTADALYGRVSQELMAVRWSETVALEHHTDYLRGRAFLGHGVVALHSGRRDDASHYLEVAANLLLAGDPGIFPRDVEKIAGLFETKLDDPDTAEAVREALARHLAE